uniref:22kDa protein n=1 Tax=Grapevine virus L TaxID=2283237 RepID=A0A482ETH3_9VIRU|nr:22kDa protein [Grapevine virus L]
MMYGRELVKSKYSVDNLVSLANRLVLDDKRLPDDVFNPLYFLDQVDEKELMRNQIQWQLEGGQKLFEFRLQQVGRTDRYPGQYANGSLLNLFLYSSFGKVDLLAMLEFLGGPYLDSCYITEENGKCTLKSQSGNTQTVGTTLEHTAGIISKLVGLFVVVDSSRSQHGGARTGEEFLIPMTTKEKPYIFKGVPSQFRNAPPLPF